MSNEDDKRDFDKLSETAKKRGASEARMRALMRMEAHRLKLRKRKIRKTVDK